MSGPNSICPKCFNPISTDICWCGSPEDDGEHTSIYHYTHNFVPMGCTCLYANPQKNPWEEIIDE